VSKSDTFRRRLSAHSESGGNELLIAAHAQAMGAAIVTAGALLENPQEGGTGQAEGEPAN